MNENLIASLESDSVVTATFRKLPAEKKNRVFLASLEAFGAKDFERVTLDEIAGEAEISKGSLIQYFRSKENIFRFAGAVIVDSYFRFSEEYFKKEPDLHSRDRLLEYLISHYTFWLEPRFRFQFYQRHLVLLSGGLPESLLMSFLEQMRNNVEAIISDGISTGEIRRDVSIERIMLTAISLQEGIMREISYDIENIDREILYNSCRKAIDLMFDGIQGERRIRSLS